MAIRELHSPQTDNFLSGLMIRISRPIAFNSWFIAPIILPKCGGLSLAPFYPYSLALSLDGMTAAIGGQTLGPGVVHRTRIVVVNLQSRMIASIINDALQEGAVQDLAWHPDGIHLAAGG